MKTLKLLTLGIATGALLMSPALLRADIIGSPHDFSGEAWNTRTADPGTVCGTCHQPHHADSSVVPLWIHTTSTATFTMYNTNNVPGSRLNATPDAALPAGGVSRACLSCHDGTVAVNSYAGGVQGSVGSIMITNSARIGTDLTHTHPISFSYNEAYVGDGFIKDAQTAVLVPESGTFNVGTNTSIKSVLLNGGDRVECSSCHDVHNQIGTPFNISSNPKLVKIVGTQSGKGSLLCRSCHVK
jgi:hypothetical protein